MVVLLVQTSSVNDAQVPDNSCILKVAPQLGPRLLTVIVGCLVLATNLYQTSCELDVPQVTVIPAPSTVASPKV